MPNGERLQGRITGKSSVRPLACYTTSCKMLVSSEATGRIPDESQRGWQCNTANKRPGERPFGKGPFWETSSSAHKLTFLGSRPCLARQAEVRFSSDHLAFNINIGTIIMDKAHLAMLAPVISGRDSDEWFIRGSGRTPLFIQQWYRQLSTVRIATPWGQASQWGQHCTKVKRPDTTIWHLSPDRCPYTMLLWRGFGCCIKSQNETLRKKRMKKSKTKVEEEGREEERKQRAGSIMHSIDSQHYPSESVSHSETRQI
ncbi:hypothetical protein V8F33_001855 [Rhypophila sp. PSN 637]